MHSKVFSAVLFDFNGTLFWDTEYHNKAWDLFLHNHSVKLTDAEKNQRIHGRVNQDVMPDLFNHSLSTLELSHLVAEKERIYQEICLKEGMQLADGAADFLDFLSLRKIPFAIATSAGKENIDFYFEHLELARWFSLDTIVYNDGTFRGKPHPDIFLRAARQIHADINESVIFEDSENGITAAENAGAGQVIIVKSGKADYSKWNYYEITSFHQIDPNLFV